MTLETQQEARARISSTMACWVAMLLGAGPLVSAPMGLLLPAVGHEFGWGRGTASTVPLIATISVAVSSPFFGRWMDRFGLRRVLIPGIVALAAAFFVLATVPQSGPVFLACIVPLGLAASSQGVVGYNKIISQWYVARRGLVLALIAACGSGLGYAVVPQIINRVIVASGWRLAYAVMGAAVLLVSLPLVWLLLRERTAGVVGASSGAPAAAVEGVTREEGFRTASFWKLAILLLLAATAFYGVLIHLFPMLLDRGMSRGAATNVISALAVGAISGQLLAAVLLDRLHTPKVAFVFFAAGLAGVLLIHHGVGTAPLFAGALLVGFGQGAENSVIGYIVSRIFGLRAFGALFGLVYAAGVAAAGIGPTIMGFMFDRLGNYSLCLTLFEAQLVIVLLLVLSLRPYAYGLPRRNARPQTTPEK